MRGLVSPVALVAVLASSLPASAQDPGPPRPARPRVPPLRALLFFERAILASARQGGVFRSTDFMIRNEESGLRDDGRTVDVEVQISFVKRQGLLLARDFFEAVLHNAEEADRSPWRLAALTLSRAESSDMWRCEKLVFARTENPEGSPARNPRPPGNRVLELLNHHLKAIEEGGLRLRLDEIEITRWSPEEDSELRIAFAIEGGDAEVGFRRVRKVFAEACSGDGLFAGLVSASGKGEEADRADRTDRSFELGLRLRLPEAGSWKPKGEGEPEKATPAKKKGSD